MYTTSFHFLRKEFYCLGFFPVRRQLSLPAQTAKKKSWKNIALLPIVSRPFQSILSRLPRSQRRFFFLRRGEGIYLSFPPSPTPSLHPLRRRRSPQPGGKFTDRNTKIADFSWSISFFGECHTLLKALIGWAFLGCQGRRGNKYPFSLRQYRRSVCLPPALQQFSDPLVSAPLSPRRRRSVA